MKAWVVKPKNEFYSGVVFAETSGKAKANAFYCDGFDDCDFIDIEARRLPQADKLYKGQIALDWYNDDDRIFLVKECGFWCGYEFFDIEECELCAAKQYCDNYNDFLNEVAKDV